MATGSTRAEAITLVRRAVDLGVTLFDSKGLLGGVDDILGEALEPVRRQVLISTKVNLAPAIWPVDRIRLLHRAAAFGAASLSLVANPSAIRAHVERTLRLLRVDYVDILSLHAVTPLQYPRALAVAVPALERLKREGKIRAIGITESFMRDPEHRMLEKALNDGAVDIAMAGFNILNCSIRPLLPQADTRNIGVIGMFAVRGGLRSEKDLAAALCRRTPGVDRRIAASRAAEFMRVLRSNGVPALTDAAYRFCRHENGIGAVLFGTSSVAHLERNVAALNAPPLPRAVIEAVDRL